MFNFLIGLIAGIAFAALFGWMNLGSKELEKLRDENAMFKEANREISANLQQARDDAYRTRPLAPPANRVGLGSSR